MGESSFHFERMREASAKSLYPAFVGMTNRQRRGRYAHTGHIVTSR
jgi:hypothetical protein